MTANNSKYYLVYLNKLDQYNNSQHRSIGKKPIDTDYSDLTEEIKTDNKGSKFKVDNSFKITKYKNIFSKGYTESWSREIFIIVSIVSVFIIVSVSVSILILRCMKLKI